MNAATNAERSSLALKDDELLDVLESSLYPGAKRASIKLVLSYCRAAGLDPMQKPVHIVPMSVKKPGTKDYEWRDVIMPGIGLYRTQAARTGQHAGTEEPVFGPMVELRVGDFTMQHPEWCRVTVYRMVGGVKCAFTATEFWGENYATASKDSTLPNAMWKKRSRGQVAKCAEAQALRKAFPEVGNQPTAEEMEGKSFDFDLEASGELKPAVPEQRTVPALENYPSEKFEANRADWKAVVQSGRKTADALIAMLSTKAVLSEEQKAEIRGFEEFDDPTGGKPAATANEGAAE